MIKSSLLNLNTIEEFNELNFDNEIRKKIYIIIYRKTFTNYIKLD